MAEKRNTKGARKRAVVEDAGADPTPAPRLRLRLRTLNDLARECARLYRETKDGRVDPNLSGKLGFLLNTLRGILADTDLERRVQALEERNDE